MQFIFFLQKFNSNKWCYLFQLKMFASCCVFFFVLLCSVIVFHFYRFFFLCFDTNLQINFTQFSGKILYRYYTDFSIRFFFFQFMKKEFFLYASRNCLDIFVIVLIFKVIDIVEFFPQYGCYGTGEF